jgi:hypothetical protein
MLYIVESAEPLYFEWHSFSDSKQNCIPDPEFSPIK